MAAHGVMDNLHHGLEVQGVVLGVEAWHGVTGAHQAAGDGGVQRRLHAAIQSGGVEALEVGALPALHVDDLDELAGLHLVGPGGGSWHPQVLVLVGQGSGEDLQAGCRGGGPVDERDDVGRRVLLVGRHLRAGYTDYTDHVGRRGQPCRFGSRGVGGEQVDRGSRAQIDPLDGQGVGYPPSVVLVSGQDRRDAGRRSARRLAE